MSGHSANVTEGCSAGESGTRRRHAVVAVSALVLSGKGGTAKTLWQIMLAGEASRAGISTLLVDADPERNLSNHFGVSQHSTGLGSVLEDAGIDF
ncbi:MULTISPECIES: ParA family protein [Mycobacterium]|uniref:ParA family protein n=1 Tax=Mycobacterium TaxID=1763 RepID=UPI0021013781|nr:MULTISPECIES: AAA family ATPase [Mycobacterium]